MEPERVPPPFVEPRLSPPSHRLFSVGAITLAAWLGSPLGGGILLAINYHRLRRYSAAVNAVLWSSVLGCAQVVWLLDVQNRVLTRSNKWLALAAELVPIVGVVAGAAIAAALLQGKDLRIHRAQGGRFSDSKWALLIAVLSLLVVLVLRMWLMELLGVERSVSD